MESELRLERIIYATGRKFKWFVYDPKTNHVFDEGLTTYRANSVRQTEEAASRVSENLGLAVRLSDYDS